MLLCGIDTFAKVAVRQISLYSLISIKNVMDWGIVHEKMISTESKTLVGQLCSRLGLACLVALGLLEV